MTKDSIVNVKYAVLLKLLCGKENIYSERPHMSDLNQSLAELMKAVFTKIGEWWENKSIREQLVLLKLTTVWKSSLQRCYGAQSGVKGLIFLHLSLKANKGRWIIIWVCIKQVSWSGTSGMKDGIVSGLYLAFMSKFGAVEFRYFLST